MVGALASWSSAVVPCRFSNAGDVRNAVSASGPLPAPDKYSRELAQFITSRFVGSVRRVWVALFFCWFALPAFAQGPELLKEVFSREYSIHIGGEQTPLVKDIASREVSVFIGAEPASPYAQAISREMSIVVTTLAIPARVTQLNVSVSPTGDRATLEWCGYNEIAQSDVVRYRIYTATTAFTNVSGLTPLAVVPAGLARLPSAT